jgi:hypothetical protein
MARDRDEEMYATNYEMSTKNQGVSVSSVAGFLEKLIAEKASPCAVRNEKTPPLRILERFDSSKIPQISLIKYVERLKTLGHCETSFLIALIYIDRIFAADSNFALTERNVHRLFFACTIVAEKFMNDDVYVNTYYAGVGGVSLREMNNLEAILLTALMWRLRVSPEEYDGKKEELRHSLADARPSESRTTRTGGSWKEWIMVKESACETETEREEKQPLSPEASTTVSGSTISGDTESDSEVSTMTISETLDSSSEVSWAVAD